MKYPVQLIALAVSLALLTACGETTYRSGEKIYKTNCANCHLDQGEGLGALIPPLAGADYLAKNRDKLACIVRHGLQDTIVVNGQVYAEKMAGNAALSEVQITNVLNYVLQSWGNKHEPLTFEEVKKSLSNCK
jgi:Cytochrome c, mono- and diheme variants